MAKGGKIKNWSRIKKETTGIRMRTRWKNDVTGNRVTVENRTQKEMHPGKWMVYVPDIPKKLGMSKSRKKAVAWMRKHPKG